MKMPNKAMHTGVRAQEGKIMSETGSPRHIQQNTETGLREASKGKRKVNWPLRIGLYLALFIFWIFALGFVENIKEPIKNGFMQQVHQGANIHQTARTYAITVGFIKGAVNFIALGLAIIFWRITRKKEARRN